MSVGETHRKERKHLKKSSSSSRHKKSSRKSEDKRSFKAQTDKTSDSKLSKRIKKITEEDYFQRQTEFRVWLTQTKNKYVDDLSTTEALHLFNAEFAKKWNRGKLATMFYTGLPDIVVEQTKRTRHCWDFVAKLGEKEKFELATAKDSVDVATKHENLLNFGDKREKKEPLGEREPRNNGKRRSTQENDDDKDEKNKQRQVERRKEREFRDTIMDEIAPKETGREAQIEKRRQVGAKLHGAAKDRENGRDGLDLSEEFLMGGHDDDNNDLKRQLTRRDLARRRKKEEQEEKLGELKAKESARMEKFLENMGLTGSKARKSATIAPRR
ncbi:hypothetical protein DD237_004591 [Peronospora effusa]|uniref:Uncharacterized protein n=1 Tax=Peronospora effusa TaxID=542832 RepID=A0A425CGI6_9STRA|nr:hypothetical protein DD237_004591 [Peronospora effusa]